MMWYIFEQVLSSEVMLDSLHCVFSYQILQSKSEILYICVYWHPPWADDENAIGKLWKNINIKNKMCEKNAGEEKENLFYRKMKIEIVNKKMIKDFAASCWMWNEPESNFPSRNHHRLRVSGKSWKIIENSSTLTLSSFPPPELSSRTRSLSQISFWAWFSHQNVLCRDFSRARFSHKKRVEKISVWQKKIFCVLLLIVGLEFSKI